MALRDSPRVSPTVRKEIQRLAEREGYVPNPVVARLIAQVRASKSSPVTAALAMVLTSPHPADADHATMRGWVEGCRQRASRLGYHLDVFRLSDPGTSPARLVRILRARGIEGIALTGPFAHAEASEDLAPLWKQRAAVVVGEHLRTPELSCVLNNQFSTVRTAMQALASLGYQRPALCLHPDLDDILESRFLGGFLAGGRLFARARQPAVFDFGHGRKAAFHNWVARARPDVILTLHPEIRNWLAAIGRQSPGDIGLVHLDLGPDLDGWSGMRQHNERVGMTAIDALVGQLHRNEFGLPPFQKTLLIESEWCAGSTTRPAAC